MKRRIPSSCVFNVVHLKQSTEEAVFLVYNAALLDHRIQTFETTKFSQ
jgi:hypothetical protein